MLWGHVCVFFAEMLQLSRKLAPLVAGFPLIIELLCWHEICEVRSGLSVLCPLPTYVPAYMDVRIQLTNKNNEN